MNEQEFDRLLATVVDTGPTQSPDYVIEGALAEIPTTPQRGPAARPWRTPMLRPIAALISTAAVVAFVTYLAFAPRGQVAVSPSDSPEPSATPSATATVSPTPTTYHTTEFAVPLSIPIDPGFGGLEFDIQEAPTQLSIRPVSDFSDRIVILPLDGTEVLTTTEPEAVPAVDELAALLDARSDVAAERLMAFDTGDPASFAVAGVDAPVVAVDTDPTDGASPTPLFKTASGEIVGVSAEPSTVWIFPVQPSGKPGILVLYAATTEDHGQWAGTLLTMLENTQIGE